MEQLNNNLPVNQEEVRPIESVGREGKQEAPLLAKIRSDYGIFAGISLLFGCIFTLLFYKAGIGLNVFIFTVVMLGLLIFIMKLLNTPVKKETVFYYIGAALLALSTMLTASPVIQLLNFIGILLLLDLSLLHQFYEDGNWDFMMHILRMFFLLFQSIACIGLPFIHGMEYLKKTRVFRNDKFRNIFLGLICSIPFLWIVTALLAEADLLFSKLTRNLFQVIFSADIVIVVFMTLFGFFACYCITCASVSKAGFVEKTDRKKADASIAITFMTVLSLVYLLFCGIQMIYLFAKGLFLLPEEFTYSEYARRGFFELLAVTVINVGLMLLCKSLFTEHKLLRSIIAVMTACTYIMIASATYRMLLYIGAYHLTFLRVFVLLSLLIITLVLAGILAAQYRPAFPLFRYCVAVTAICYILFSFSKPDYYIAAYLLNQQELLQAEDVYFLTNELSLDAAPSVLSALENRKISLPDSDTEMTESKLINYDEYGYPDEKTMIDLYYKKINDGVLANGIRDFNLSIFLAGNSIRGAADASEN